MKIIIHPAHVPPEKASREEEPKPSPTPFKGKPIDRAERIRAIQSANKHSHFWESVGGVELY